MPVDDGSFGWRWLNQCESAGDGLALNRLALAKKRLRLTCVHGVTLPNVTIAPLRIGAGSAAARLVSYGR